MALLALFYKLNRKQGIRGDYTLLKGYIKFEDYYFSVYGVDTSSSLNLTLCSPLVETMRFLDPDNNEITYSEKRVKIKGSTMSIESEKGYDGKRYKPNLDFFAKLGVLLRYIKNNCINKNSEFQLDTGTFDARVKNDYSVDVGGSIAKVTLAYSLITDLHFKGLGFEIELESVNSTRAYYTTNENVTLKFKKSDLRELLGIEVEEPVRLDFSNINSESSFYANVEEIVAAHPNKDFSWLFDRDYRIVTDETLEETINYLNQFEVLAMDTETTGLKITFKSRTGEHDQCVGIIITGKEGESFYFPMKHTKIKNLCDGDDWYFMETYIKPLMVNKKIIVHNASFDWKVLWIYSIPTNVVFDTMIAFALTMTAKYNTPYGLKDLTSLILKRDSLELDDLCLSGDFSTVDETFADLPEELVRLYACADADNTLALYNYIIKTKMLEEYNAVKVAQFESLFSCVIAYSEFHGQFTDVNRTDELVAHIEHDIKSSMDTMKKELVKAGYDPTNFNPNSNPQKLNIIYDVLGCPEQVNLAGKRTADKKALERLAKMTDSNDEPLYPFVVALRRYNESETLRKNFTKSLPELCTPDGFMFSGVDQFKSTGRVSTKNPNYQGYNSTVKKYIVPRPGYYMSDSDYSSIEYRVIASLSGQESLIEAFADPNMDYHKLQASNMFNVPYELVTSEMRKKAKPFNFGIPFGMGDAKLGLQLFGSISNENTRKASFYREKYFKNQEKVRMFFANAQKEAVENGYTETYFCRRRYYNKETTSVGSIKRQGGNQKIQGTAADIYKQACVRLFLRLINEDLLDKVLIVGFIHDEILCEVSLEIHPLRWLKILKDETELKIKGFCPIYIGFGVGRSWYEAKSVEIPSELQQQIQGNYDEFPNWDGNIDEFCDWVPERINQFEMEYVDKFITKPENQGKVISSVTFDYLARQVHRMQDEYLVNFFMNHKEPRMKLDLVTRSILMHRSEKLVHKSKAHKPSLEDYIKAFCDKNKVEYLNWVLEVEDQDKDLIDYSDLQTLIDFYCKVRGIDRGSVNLLSPSDVKVTENEDESKSTEGSETVTYYEQGVDEERAKKIFITKVKEYGSHLDVDKRIAYFKYDKSLMNILQRYINKNNQGYSVAFYDIENDKRYVTKSCITSDRLSLVQREIMLAGV